MDSFALLRLLHIASAAFYAGSLFTMLIAQSLLQRETNDGDRGVQVRLSFKLARMVVMPAARAAFGSGLVYWLAKWIGLYGAGRLMSCSPVYVHIMLTCGFLALGLTEMWKGRVRKTTEAIERGAPPEEVRGHLTRGWIFALAAMAFICIAMAVAVLKVPGGISARCFADSFPK